MTEAQESSQTRMISGNWWALLLRGAAAVRFVDPDLARPHARYPGHHLRRLRRGGRSLRGLRLGVFALGAGVTLIWLALRVRGQRTTRGGRVA